MKTLIWPILVVIGICGLTTRSVRTAVPLDRGQQAVLYNSSLEASSLIEVSNADATVLSVNAELHRLRSNFQLQLAEPADELTIFRRLSLALHGTIPSLEEIRKFEADMQAGRLERWLERMLQDNRFADYFAERIGRGFVGVEGGQFLIFRRDRFMDWMSTQLKANRPYNLIVHEMVSGTGIWTSEGGVNFITSAFADDEFDPNKLTARAVRGFLGQRMDCAQCHDHPFDRWKQSEFEGLTAHFGQVQLGFTGVADKKEEYTVLDPATQEKRTIPPAVPFHPEWLGETGSRRDRLARWMTHPENQRFERAIANRVWGLLFGAPFVVDRPVDDLPDPNVDPDTKVIDLLGADFRQHNYDLRRLIRVIVATDAFRVSSIYSSNQNETEQPTSEEELDLARKYWAVFPLIRLRPEQVIGSMLQANQVRTIDQNSHLFVRALRFFRERNFVDEFGDPGVEELQEWSGTILQALLRMNGEFSRELTSLTPLSASGRIAFTGSTPEKQIIAIYLACLTRTPTTIELDYFKNVFETEDSEESVEDLYWILFNSPEFSWNH